MKLLFWSVRFLLLTLGLKLWALPQDVECVEEARALFRLEPGGMTYGLGLHLGFESFSSELEKETKFESHSGNEVQKDANPLAIELGLISNSFSGILIDRSGSTKGLNDSSLGVHVGLRTRWGSHLSHDQSFFWFTLHMTQVPEESYNSTGIRLRWGTPLDLFPQWVQAPEVFPDGENVKSRYNLKEAKDSFRFDREADQLNKDRSKKISSRIDSPEQFSPEFPRLRAHLGLNYRSHQLDSKQLRIFPIKLDEKISISEFLLEPELTVWVDPKILLLFQFKFPLYFGATSKHQFTSFLESSSTLGRGSPLGATWLNHSNAQLYFTNGSLFQSLFWRISSDQRLHFEISEVSVGTYPVLDAWYSFGVRYEQRLWDSVLFSVGPWVSYSYLEGFSFSFLSGASMRF